MPIRIDTAFDFRSDTPPGKDPDSHSPTLRSYHKFLWSKPLPSGARFELIDTTPGVYLHHQSESGEFQLSSDTVVPTFRRERRLAEIIKAIPGEDLDSFNAIGYTIGGMMVFPGRRAGGKMTINGARGFHPRIKDRFDLTLECIRLYYQNESSPLSDTLSRYSAFFDLFGDFHGYVSFFLLQDLVNVARDEVRFFLPFAGFKESPLPATRQGYVSYRQRAIEFIEARNQRIATFCETGSAPT